VSDIKGEREKLGWSRRQLAETLGWPMSRVWAYETGKREPTADEAVDLRAALTGSSDHPSGSEGSEEGLQPDPKQVELDGDLILKRRRVELETPEGSVRLVDWEGLSLGKLVKVKGKAGSHRFWFYHKDDHQEYVQLMGGKGNRQAWHMVSPDRIIMPRRKK